MTLYLPWLNPFRQIFWAKSSILNERDEKYYSLLTRLEGASSMLLRPRGYHVFISKTLLVPLFSSNLSETTIAFFA